MHYQRGPWLSQGVVPRPAIASTWELPNFPLKHVSHGIQEHNGFSSHTASKSWFLLLPCWKKKHSLSVANETRPRLNEILAFPFFNNAKILWLLNLKKQWFSCKRMIITLSKEFMVSPLPLLMLAKVYLGGLRTVSGILSAGCSCWRPGFGSQHPHGGPKPSVTPATGDPTPYPGLHGHCTHSINTYIWAKHSHT